MAFLIDLLYTIVIFNKLSIENWHKRTLMRKEIDLNTWDRKEHFEFFSRNATPHYCVAFNVDVTNLLHFTRTNKLSFYYSLVYLCTQTVNEIDAFLMETEDNKVYAIDQRIASFIDLAKGSTVFHVVCLPQQQDIFAFCSQAREQSTNNPLTLQQSCQITDPKVIFSCLPWLDMTTCTNERDYTDAKLKDDTAPIIVWGKYIQKDGKFTLNMTLDVNHRLIDGYHVGQFAQKLQNIIDSLC